MTLTSSGQISMQDLKKEYTDLSDKAEVRLSSFYYGKSTTSSYLAKNACSDAIRATISDSTKHPGFTPHLEGIPAVSDPVGDTPIKLTHFYGKSYYYAPQSASNVSGDNTVFNPAIEEGNALKSNTINSAFIDVNASGQNRGTTTSNPGLTIATKNRSHTTVWLNIPSDQRIIGKGGAGGNGNDNNGNPGGHAIQSNIHIFLNNNGRVLGGGGGGGASGCATRTFKEAYCAGNSNGSVGGCGGGGGKGTGAGGSPSGANCGGNFPTDGFGGDAADESNDGAGGSGGSGTRYLDSTVDGTAIYCNANAAAAGGGWGSGGGNSSGNGGAAGKALYVASGMYRKITASGIIAGTTNESY